MQTSLVRNIGNTILKNKNHPNVRNHVGELYNASQDQLLEAVISAVLMAARTQGGKHSRLEGVKITDVAAKILEKHGTFKSQGVDKKIVERLTIALIELNVLDRGDRRLSVADLSKKKPAG